MSRVVPRTGSPSRRSRNRTPTRPGGRGRAVERPDLLEEQPWPRSPSTTPRASTPAHPRPAVDALNLDIADGEFLVLVGPSGCGKSTSLRMLAGLEEVNGGAIRIGDRDVTHIAPKDRDIAMVFQNYALYPHMSVADNMGFALKIAGMDKDADPHPRRGGREVLDLSQYLDRKPKALSGGQRQRVAMGRAIVRQPAVLPDGRTAVQPRRQAAGADPHRDRVAAAPARDDDGVRHPRPGRGHDHGRPGRAAQGRAPAAGRHPAPPLRPARTTSSSPASSARRR